MRKIALFLVWNLKEIIMDNKETNSKKPAREDSGVTGIISGLVFMAIAIIVMIILSKYMN